MIVPNLKELFDCEPTVIPEWTRYWSLICMALRTAYHARTSYGPNTSTEVACQLDMNAKHLSFPTFLDRVETPQHQLETSNAGRQLSGSHGDERPNYYCRFARRQEFVELVLHRNGSGQHK